MKQRIISGALCVVVLALILCFYKTLVLEAAVCVISAIAVYELLTADGFREHKPFLYFAVATAAAVPYLNRVNLVPAVLVFFVATVIVLLLKFHSEISFEKVSFLVVATIGVSMSFLCLLLLRNKFENSGLLYILIAFGGAWFADTGAFFTGKFFGKHKLSPKISPKKTVEGAVGGVISNVVLLCLLAFVYQKICTSIEITINISYINLSILAIVVTFAGMAGDLVASVIKRHIGIKDYGKIIPGHGGIMDRFDSILFTVPVVYLFSQTLTVIS